MICPACKTSVPDKFKFCTKCGLDLSKPFAQRTCPNCGFSNDARAAFCSSCGRNLSGRESRPHPGPEGMITCRSCGRSVRADYTECPNCHASLLVPTFERYVGSSVDIMDYFPTIAGIVLMVAGILAFWTGFNYLVDHRALNYDWWGFFFLVSGELSILAGGFSIAKYHFVFVALGAVLVALTIGPLFITTILGGIGFILIVFSWDQFAG